MTARATDPGSVARPSEGSRISVHNGLNEGGSSWSNRLTSDSASLAESDRTRGSSGAEKSEGGPKGEARLDPIAHGKTNFRNERQAERNRARDVLDPSERSELLAQVRYWQGLYSALVAVLAEVHPDPAYAWLDELTRVGAVNLTPAIKSMPQNGGFDD